MTPWVTRLIIANVVVFLLSLIIPALVQLGSFVPVLILDRPWSLVTYMFLHGGLWHLAFNMLGLVFFGSRLELELGSKHFLLLYFISGISGALLSFLTPFVSIIGASGAVFGVLVGFARYWPREPIWIWGVLPIQARWLVIVMTALSLVSGFTGADDAVAHFAHLGGFAGGYIFLVWRDRNTRAARFQAQFAVPAVTSADLGRWRAIDRNRMHEVNREEYDRIMAKVDTGGVGTLTADERRFLDRFVPD